MNFFMLMVEHQDLNIYFLHLFFVVLTSGGARASDESDYVQLSCKVDSSYVFVETIENNFIGGKRGFIFTETGITFRVKPYDYAKEFRSIRSIVYRDKSDGLVSVFVNLVDKKGSYVERIGAIKRDCWVSIENISTKGGVRIIRDGSN